MNKRIPLNLSGAKNTAYASWPVTQGIPFADGALAHDDPVRVVDENGQPLPTQAKCLATWDKDLRYVKWLLVDFQADLQAGKERQLFLEYGPEAVPPEPETRIVVNKVTFDPYYLPDITVDTGALQAVFRQAVPFGKNITAFDFLASCRITGAKGVTDLFAASKSPFLHMLDQHGVCYDSCTAAPVPQVSVEEAGPLRACICVKGFLASRHGQKFCPYILRLHFFAGKSDIRIYHTFIFDQDPHFIELASIGMKFPLDLGGNLRMAVGGEKTPHECVADAALAIAQTSDIDYQVEIDDRPVGKGRKSAGWAGMAGSKGSAVAAIRYHWQEYPKGFQLGRDGLDVQVWPSKCGKTLKFTTPFEEPAIFFNRTRDEEQVKRLLAERPTAPLNLKSFGVNTEKDLLWVEDMVDKYAQGRAISYNDTGTGNGAGAAKTTEIWLRLATRKIDDREAGAFCDCVQEPLIAPADPAHTCATRAVGHFYQAGDPRFEPVDSGMDDILQRVAVDPTEKCRLYGMMRYGNMVCSHAPGPALAYLHFGDKEPEKAMRFVGPYNNEANDQIASVWGNFIHSGRRDQYFLAQRYSRNVADVCFIHSPPAEPSTIGQMHYHNANQWSGGNSPSHSLIRGLLLDYFFTGNRRLLEVAKENTDALVSYQEPAGIITCPSYVLHREFTGPLWNLLEIYQATWEEKYGDLARRSLNWFLRTLPAPGNYPVSVFTSGKRGDEAVVEPPAGSAHAGDMYYLYEIALRLFDSKPLRDTILAEANDYVWNILTDNLVTAEMARKKLTERSLLWQVDQEFYWTQWGAGPSCPGMVCLAYDLTGDMLYAVYAKEMLSGTFLRLAERIRHFYDFRFTWIGVGGYIPCLMSIVAEAMDRDPKKFAQVEAEWLDKRRQKGMPVYKGPGPDLEKDILDVNANIVNRPPVDLPRQAPPLPREPVLNLGKISTEDLPAPKSHKAAKLKK